MKRLKRISIILVSILLVTVALSACKPNLDDISKDLSKYTIDAVFNDEKKTLSVNQVVEYVNASNTEIDEVMFHLYPNAYSETARFTPFASSEIFDAYPNGVSYGGISISEVKVNGAVVTSSIQGQDNDILVVPLASDLMPTDKTTISLSYELSVPNVRHRFGYYGKTVNLGNFYPIACKFENGEFVTNPYYSNGDPFYSDVANYSVSILAPKKYMAAMSGDIEMIESGSDFKWVSSALAMRDFAIVLGEFVAKTDVIVDGVLVNYYYYNDEEAEKSLTIASDSIKTFNQMFGGYPYKTLSVVQTAFLAGGMEYPGLVYISDAKTGEVYRDIIVHEIAHQWWYAVVGNNQIDHAWLDETTAEYSASLFYQANPSYNVDYSKRIADALTAYSLYCEYNPSGLDTSVVRKLPDYKSSLEYTVMTYTKGQIMMDSLRRTIGDEAFFKALKTYYAEYSFKEAKPDDFIAAFEKASKRDLDSFFSTWLDGKVVTFSKS